MSTPPPDVTAVIASQHEQVKLLLNRVRQQAGQARTEAFHTLRLTLALHETAEEQAIHPQAERQLDPYDRPVIDRIAEEQTAGQTIGMLEMLDVDSDQFNSTFENLASSVVDHAAAEENDEWPALRQIADVTIVQGMVEQMQAVTRLAGDPSAPAIGATFEEMRQWAESLLPQPPALTFSGPEYSATAQPRAEAAAAPQETAAEDEQELRQKIEQTREQLGATVEQLAAKADVTGRARAKAAQVRAKAATQLDAKRSQIAGRTATARRKVTAAGSMARAQLQTQATPVWEKAPEPLRRTVAAGASTARQRRLPQALVAVTLIAGYLALRWWRKPPSRQGSGQRRSGRAN
jgi:hemerythrin superfamily protein